MSEFTLRVFFFFFFNDTATTEIYTLSLHDALPISPAKGPSTFRSSPTRAPSGASRRSRRCWSWWIERDSRRLRSEEHTSELQSRQYLVCRLLLEKKHHSPSYSFLCFGDVYKTNHQW